MQAQHTSFGKERQIAAPQCFGHAGSNQDMIPRLQKGLHTAALNHKPERPFPLQRVSAQRPLAILVWLVHHFTISLC